MTISRHSDGKVGQALREARTRLSDLRPVMKKTGEWIVRKAQRNLRASTKRTSGMTGLGRSLHHVEPDSYSTVLASDKPYALVQQYGGTIRAGTGPLKSKLLAIPLNEEARRMIGNMGTSQSLRERDDLQFIRSRRGRMFLVRKFAKRRTQRRSGSARRPQYQRRIGAIQVMFLLVPRVTIRAKDYAPHATDPDLAEFFFRRLHEHVTERRTA